MAVISHKLGIVYFDVPKVACTSLKTLLWEIENGRRYRRPPKSKLLKRVLRRLRLSDPNIHYAQGFQTFSFARTDQAKLPEEYERITVLRDPIARLYSAWSNKANTDVFASRDELEDLRNEGLSLSPTFSEFLRDFERYKSVSRPVRVHNLPYAWHLGPDLGYYQRCFKMENMRELESYLSERAGRRMELPRANRSKGKREVIELSSADIERLLALTKPEYDWLGPLYDPEVGLGAFLDRTTKSP